MNPFIGRAAELGELRSLGETPQSKLVIVEGRRRIGKSRLVEEFARGQRGRRFLQFVGLAPTPETTAQTQRDEFARQLSAQTDLPRLSSDDWATLFQLLGREVRRGRVLVLFDEISWMAHGDPTFLGKLKTAWDLHFSKSPRLMLILCGSVSSWIQKNIVSSTAYLGRPSRDIKLEELTLPECNQFWPANARISPYEKLKVLAVTGGVPRYLELIDPRIGAEDNIRGLLFSRNSVLLREFDFIFSDTFGARSAIYRKIARSLVPGSASLTDILAAAQRSKTGDYSEYLEDMVRAGFLARDYTWKLVTGELSKLSKFRLKDNFIRFYLRYVAVNRPRIERGFFESRSLASLPGWEGMLALQFENLVLNNSPRLIERLGVPLEDVVFANPYFQSATKDRPGCQIDLAVQTRFNTVYACEIKFSKSPVKPSITDEVEQKLARLKLPRQFSVRPVLIHVNGAHREVIDGRFFSRVVDFSELLTGRVS
ncbi:MAG: AAA family ATPase [Steroidobacteraceae bacterium]